ncbi:hypothetical protein AUP68_13990 [Ilyonectria robusta]
MCGRCIHTEPHNQFCSPSFLRPNSTSMIARDEASSLRPPSRIGVEGGRSSTTASASSVAQFVHPIPVASLVVIGDVAIGKKGLLGQTCHIGHTRQKSHPGHAGGAPEESQEEQTVDLPSESFSRPHRVTGLWQDTGCARLAQHKRPNEDLVPDIQSDSFKSELDKPRRLVVTSSVQVWVQPCVLRRQDDGSIEIQVPSRSGLLDFVPVRRHRSLQFD